MLRWLLHKIAGWVARYPRLSLGLVIAYVVGSTLEMFPPLEFISDFIVLLSYLLLFRYIRRRRLSGNPVI